MQQYGGGTFDSNGHTEWVEGDVHEAGFTTTFTPNTIVAYVDNGVTYDVDLTSMRNGESATVPTYAAVTSRSYHPGVVNVVLLDGSVRSIDDTIELRVLARWARAKGAKSAVVSINFRRQVHPPASQRPATASIQETVEQT